MNKKNRWKIAFLTLLGVIVIFVIVIGCFIFVPSKSTPVPNTTSSKEKVVQFHVKTNKDDLNQIINHYIEEKGLNSAIKYNVFLKDDVELHGSVPIFSEDIPLKMTFTPTALENGDLVLKQKSISLGNLNIPVTFVLNLVKNSYSLPEWVTIRPNQKTVYVGLQNMAIGQSDMKVRIDQFDLKKDDISFTLLFPTDK